MGLTNESAVILANLFLFYKILIQKSKKVNFLSLLFLWLGSAIQIFSPGNFNRRIHPNTLKSTFSLFERIISFFSMEHTALIMKILLFSVSFSFYLIKRQNKKIFVPKEWITISCMTCQ